MAHHENTMREARKHADLTQQGLADLLGVHQPTVADWESGRVGPRLDTARKVAAALCTTVDALWPIQRAAPPEPEPEPRRESERARRRREWDAKKRAAA
jgi:DNA-binding XRE family transcriptional regulator